MNIIKHKEAKKNDETWLGFSDVDIVHFVLILSNFFGLETLVTKRCRKQEKTEDII